MKRRSVPELLAPAGSVDALHAAVENGADAVYFGLATGNFNARSRATNIPLDRLGETISFLRRRGVRGYVTLNTLVRCDELPEIETILRELDAARVDAVLVQDFGIARLARRLCPDLILHASTQMSLTSKRGIEQAQTLGVRRIVLPRELSIRQIRKLRRDLDRDGNPVELETFVHGALCMSFSGQCYASLALGGRDTNERSANRGRCAQPCRLAYTLIDGETNRPVESFEEPKQLLSPTDLAALPVLSELVRSGVDSLKIEGRLKPPEYVAEVTRAYRNALDRLAPENSNENKDEEVESELRRLSLTFSRGFSTGWLEGVRPRTLVPGNVSAHRGAALGTVIEMRRDAVVVRLSASVRRGDGVLFENEKTPEKSQGGRVYEIIRRRESVVEAESGAKVLLTFANDSIDPTFVLPDQTVRKTDDPRLQREIRKSLESGKTRRRIPLDIDVQAVVGKPIRVFVQNSLGASLRFLGDDPLQQARKHPITIDVLREQFDRLGETNYRLGKFAATIEGDPMVPLSVLGKLRHEMIEKLDAFEPPLRPTLESERRPDETTSVKPAVADLETLRNENQVHFSQRESKLRNGENPILHLLLRDVKPFENTDALRRIVEAGCASFYAELRDVEQYELAAKNVRKIGGEFVAVLPRIIKPGEVGLLHEIARTEPDGVLVRNLEELVFFRDKRKNESFRIVADFSLNVVNDLSFRQLLDWGADRITPGWDLDAAALRDLAERVPAEKIERIVAGRMPLFTMEHCLWRANLIDENSACGKICRTKSLKIRDRRGVLHTVRSDMLCRNIVENAGEIEWNPEFSNGNHLRIEWDARLGDATPEETVEKISGRL